MTEVSSIDLPHHSNQVMPVHGVGTLGGPQEQGSQERQVFLAPVLHLHPASFLTLTSGCSAFPKASYQSHCLLLPFLLPSPCKGRDWGGVFFASFFGLFCPELLPLFSGCLRTVAEVRACPGIEKWSTGVLVSWARWGQVFWGAAMPW